VTLDARRTAHLPPSWGHSILTGYLEQAKMAWQKAIENYRKTTEINPSLRRAQIALDETEAVYEKMCTVLGRITEKG